MAHAEPLRSLFEAIISTDVMQSVDLQKFAETYRRLDAQFPTPKRHWYDRIPYSWGWWWRVPYGLWLKLTAPKLQPKENWVDRTIREEQL